MNERGGWSVRMNEIGGQETTDDGVARQDIVDAIGRVGKWNDEKSIIQMAEKREKLQIVKSEKKIWREKEIRSP